MHILRNISLAAAVLLPFFNIPMIVRIVRRRSSADISTVWLMGVWICCLLMAPSGFTSKDLVWRCYNIVNLVLFTGVVIAVWKYRKSHG
ncbi:MAG: hypothetical protein KGJ09_05275 [Candidatus Omnitrophica bacterium]|nr:hypothetical protein [Candidatus Omnitrophota bacterium]MDE2009474.1 hypothetical protein [Candidatus Omnitrophota bacterium]MDE2214685.1 hypothetical protein [Candidatus Omnitrophota bacterium]